MNRDGLPSYCRGVTPNNSTQYGVDLAIDDSIPFKPSTYSFCRFCHPVAMQQLSAVIFKRLRAPCQLFALRKLTVLGIESSCDDTGVALVNDEKKILGETLHSQGKMHREYELILLLPAWNFKQKFHALYFNPCCLLLETSVRTWYSLGEWHATSQAYSVLQKVFSAL